MECKRIASTGLLLIGLVGCTRSPSQINVDQAIIDAPSEFDGAVEARDEARALVQAKVEGARNMTWQSASPTHTARLNLWEAYTINESGVPDETWLASFELRPLLEGPHFEATVAVTDSEDVKAMLVEGVERSWPLLQRMRALDVQKDEALIRALAEPEPEVRRFAIDRVGERRLRSAVPILLKLLSPDEDPTRTLHVVGALVNIGDEAAVGPMIDLTARRPTPFVLQVVFAVSRLGGRSAESFLVTLASGHPDPEVQQGAKDALVEMRARSPKKP